VKHDLGDDRRVLILRALEEHIKAERRVVMEYACRCDDPGVSRGARLTRTQCSPSVS
jgi:hypothetical protein